MIAGAAGSSVLLQGAKQAAADTPETPVAAWVLAKSFPFAGPMRQTISFF